VVLGPSISAHDAPDFYLNSDTLRIRRAAAIARKTRRASWPSPR
jgi:hypothetical protein